MSSGNLSEAEIEKIKNDNNEYIETIIKGIDLLQSTSITDKLSDKMVSDYLQDLFCAIDLVVIKLIAHKRQTIYELTGGKTSHQYLFSNIDKHNFDYDDVNYIKPIVYCPIEYSIPNNADEKTRKQLSAIDDDIEKLKQYLDKRFTDLYVLYLEDGENIRKINYEDSDDVECLSEFIRDSIPNKEQVQNYSEEALNFYKIRNRCLLNHILSLKSRGTSDDDARADLIVGMKPVVEMPLFVESSKR